MRKLLIDIRLNETHTQRTEVFGWEAPVLEAVHGADALSVVGETHVDLPVPDPEAEYQRLLSRYRAHSESPDEPYVAEVYGKHRAGVQALAREIAAFIDPEEVGISRPAQIDIEPILAMKAGEAIASIGELTDAEACERIADEESGDPRPTVRDAARARAEELAGPVEA